LEMISPWSDSIGVPDRDHRDAQRECNQNNEPDGMPVTAHRAVSLFRRQRWFSVQDVSWIHSGQTTAARVSSHAEEIMSPSSQSPVAPSR
jgi:hypothetical protein